jgi:hypothetical protein
MVDAVSDYRYFLDRGYPGTGALQLVGDRYRLSRQERMILYRGVCDENTARRHRARLVSIECLLAGPIADRAILVDGHNVLFTLMNYCLGRRVFISDDGLVRDAGGAHRRVSQPEILAEVIRSVCEFLARNNLSAVVFLDEPLTHSHDHARMLREAAAETGATITVSLARSADAAILDQPDRPIASSDSAIIDGTNGPIVDIARCILQEVFKANLLSLPESYPRARSFL